MVRQGKGAKDRTLWTGEHNLAPSSEWSGKSDRSVNVLEALRTS